MITIHALKLEFSKDLFAIRDGVNSEINSRIEFLLKELYDTIFISRIADKYIGYDISTYHDYIILYFKKVALLGDTKEYTHKLTLTLPISFLNYEHDNLEEYLKPMFLNNPFDEKENKL